MPVSPADAAGLDQAKRNEVKTVCQGNLEFSALSVGDVADIGSLCQGCAYWELPEEFDRGLSPQEMRRLKEEWLTAHTTSGVVGQMAREEGRAVGFIQFGPPELYPQQANYPSGPICPDAILITCLFVKPEFRRQGLARRLLALAEAEARQAGYSAIETFARRGSSDNPSGPIELYLRCGFGVKRDDEEFPLLRKAVRVGHGSPETSGDAGK